MNATNLIYENTNRFEVLNENVIFLFNLGKYAPGVCK